MNKYLSQLTLTSFILLFISACNSDSHDKVTPPMMDDKNTAPTAMDLSVTIQADTEFSGTLTATDKDGDTLLYSLSSGASYGSVEVNADGTFSYVPQREYTGSDSFKFSVSDGVNGKVTAMVNITIELLEVTFSSYSRAAFEQNQTDTPLSVNGRLFIQDVTSGADYNDLLEQ
ncbi:MULTISPECIES: Ig-like domain-containing protein [Pseudoalteromonas]|uniref:Cadherin domain-containing protein n=1 Tax=Pseudoalteromonas amylolytica TaxID=1859457 RepID=A0A1S1MW85_9GAMM|nr:MULTISPECIES: Ig-like domain-containing protein [Pseudoalteromonas]OHU86251.1 hypothetical protein BFC16_16235 [Pseudoalteromonas sp. JW3]OHU89644.1 hypothetical protein BET10_16085 [Pseudoalteromonas amylolytica]